MIFLPASRILDSNLKLVVRPELRCRDMNLNFLQYGTLMASFFSEDFYYLSNMYLCIR